MEKKNVKKDKYKLLEPVLYPELRKKFIELDVDEEKFNDIGLITMNLIKHNEVSIYKLLYNRELNSDYLSTGNTKSIRSEYLKRLVSTNEDYFPKELLNDKFKRRADLSLDEKFKHKILSMKDKAKSEKAFKKNCNENNSRKTSFFERKESIDIVENKKHKPNEEPINILEEPGSEPEENEDQSFEEDYVMNSDEDGGSNSEEANYSDGGD